MKLQKGTYSRIAKRFGCSPSLVAKVDRGLRRNLRIELALEQERLDQMRRYRHLCNLRSIINSHRSNNK